MTRYERRITVFCVFTVLAYSVPAAAQSAPPQNAAAITVNCASVAPLNSDAKPLLDGARKSLDAGQDSAAIDSYKALIAKNLAIAYAYAGLARVYLHENNVAEALAAAQQGANAAPNTVVAQAALGEVYYRQGKLGDAERAFNSTCGNDAAAQVGLARIYEITANYLMARNALLAAHRLAPDDPDIRYVWMYGSGNGARIGPHTGRIKLGGNADAKDDDGAPSTEAPAEDGPPGEHCKAISKQSSFQLALDPNYVEGPGHTIGSYLMRTNLDGVQASLLVDTGADGIYISRKIAEKAGIKPLMHRSVDGLGDKGPNASYVGYVNSLKIGDLELSGCYVDVAERKTNVADADGLIGTIVFEDFLVDIDLPNGKLKLSPLPPLPAQMSGTRDENSTLPQRNRYIAAEMKDYSPVFRFGSDIVIPTAVNSQLNKLFLLDTGSFGDIISPSAAKEVTSEGRSGVFQVQGVNGTVNRVGTAGRLVLTFAKMQQERDETVSLGLDSTSAALHTEISGILGFDMLRYLDIKLDYRDALVKFTHDPHRLYR
jgi:tetratricopeptide (TPR) repeat protein